MKKFYLFQLLMSLSVAAFAQVAVTFSVDMSSQTVSANGLYVAGDFQGWSPGQAAYQLKDSNGDNIYRVTATVNPSGGKLTFKYVNDNTWGNNETFGSETGSCIVADPDGNKNRVVEVPAGVTSMELPTWIYDSCKESSIVSSLRDFAPGSGGMKISPNPFSDVAVLTFSNPDRNSLDLRITNLTGQVVLAINNLEEDMVEINRGDLVKGIYFASLISPTGMVSTQRMLIQ